MRSRVLLISVLAIGHAHADRAKTARPPRTVVGDKPARSPAKMYKTTSVVVLRARPGERSAVVAKLAAGTTIELEREEGRWLRVRVGRQVGYVTRTTVEDVSPTLPTPTPPPATPITTPVVEAPRVRWGADREASTSGLYVGVTAPVAVLRAEPRTNATTIAEVARDTKLAVIDAATPGWIQVRDDQGRVAWIARGDVDNTQSAAIAITGSQEPVRETVRPASVVRAVGRTSISAGAAIGYRSLGMDFTSNGSAGLANYLVSADAAAADLGIDVAMRFARLRVGIDGRVQVASSSPGSGIEYVGPSRAGGTIPFSTFAFDAGLRAGTRVRMFELAVRAGAHYDAFVAKDLENAGRLPREHLFGATLGGRVDIAPPHSRVTVALRLDVLALGTRSQTAGLEDGTQSDAGAVWAGATIRVALRRHLSLSSTYDFGRATTEWSGMSVRFADVTSARRVDNTQTVQLGISAEL